MLKSYFFRDIKDISELRRRTLDAIQNHVTPIPYNIDTIIELNNNEFIEFSSQISKEHPKFMNYKSKMIADNKGVWNCIVVKNIETNEMIAMYYGGFRYPRFVGIV